jgi:hypothetical protein
MMRRGNSAQRGNGGRGGSFNSNRGGAGLSAAALLNYPLAAGGYYQQQQPLGNRMAAGGIQQKMRNQRNQLNQLRMRNAGGMGNPLLSKSQRRKLNLKLRIQQETLLSAGMLPN